MERYVALLRGINVGRGNRVPMAELRALLERLGFSHVSTLLNSGNAVFCGPVEAPERVGAAVAQALVDALGVSVPVIVKSGRQWLSAMADNPVSEVPEPSRLLVAFASSPGELEKLGPLEALLMPGELLHLTANAAYLHCVGGILESKAAAALLGKLGRGVTTRNWATVSKIEAALARLPRDD